MTTSPPIEPVGLRQYRIRHALYKADPDLQECHRRQAWIPIFDDHEVCDNTYDGGAANHEPDGDPDYGDGTRQEGDFYLRRRRAYQAYLEWMPIRLPGQTGAVGEYRFWRRFTYGDLADLSVLETRQNRSMQVSASDAQALMSPDRHLPEPQQLDWLTANIARVDQQWHLLGNQVVIAPVRVPALPAGFQVPPGFGTFTQGAVFNTDQWDGYQVDQAAVFTAMKNAPNDTVVFTGDIHSSWANDLPDAGYTDAVRQGFSVGTEFVCPSVTSDGFYEIFARNRQAATGATTWGGLHGRQSPCSDARRDLPRLRRRRRHPRAGARRLVVDHQRAEPERPATGPERDDLPRGVVGDPNWQPDRQPGRRRGGAAPRPAGRCD